MGCKRLKMLTLTNKNFMSYINIYQQFGESDIRSKCLQSLFIEIIDEQCFHTLR